MVINGKGGLKRRAGKKERKLKLEKKKRDQPNEREWESSMPARALYILSGDN
jgi:hypothetical protein